MTTATQELAMPSREGDLTIEAHGMEAIPATRRYGSVSRTFTVWFTPNLVPAGFAIGLLAAAEFLQVGFVTGLIAIIVGNVVGAALVGLLSEMGPKTGMAQMPFARLPYGKSIVLPGLLNWISCIGWDGINSIFGAAAITVLLPSVPFWLALVVIVLAQGALGVVGYEGIHMFERYGAIVLGIMFAVLTVAIAGKASTGMARVDGFDGLDQIGAFILFSSISASFVLAWALYASDYSRYLPADASSRKVFGYTVLGLALSAGWVETLGLLVADQAKEGGAVDTINNLLGSGALGAVAMIAIVIGTIAVNAMNDYTGSLSLQAAGIGVKRIYSAVAVAVLGFAFTLYLHEGDFAAKFENYLLFISYWIAPWAGVVLVDWWARGRKADTERLAHFSRLPSGVLGLIALVVGFGASLPFQTSTFGQEIADATGLPINAAAPTLHYADVAYLVGFGVACAIYWLGLKTGFGRHAEAMEPAQTAA